MSSWSGRGVGALTLGALGCAGLVITSGAWGCSSSFSGCAESRTCATDGQGGEGGNPAEPGGAGEGQGATSVTAGSHSGSGAGDANLPEGGAPPAAAGGGGTESGGTDPGPQGGTGGSDEMPAGGSGMGMGGEPQAPDDVPPTVLSTDPELGDEGVPSDAEITITFSEAMDKVATQAAFQSANLGGVTFDWPADDTLVVTPNAPLVYAEGTTLGVAAKSYGFSLTTAAKDLAGNALKKTVISDFTTLRQLTMVVPRSDKYYEYDDGTVRTLIHPNLQQGVYVGDEYNLQFTNNEWIRALIVFNLEDLPIGIESFVSATLSVSVCCPVGAPNGLGGILVDHIHLSPVTDAMTAVTRLSRPGTLAAAPTNGKKTMSVKAAFENAYAQRAARGQRMQLRFEFEQVTNDDDVSDRVELDQTADGPNAAQISATFLIP